MLRKLFIICCICFVFIPQSYLQAQNYPTMVFVKGGSFKMGSNSGERDERPVHRVTLSDYYIGKYEVTVSQYKEFCRETGRNFPSAPSSSWYEEHQNATKWVWKDNNPIVNVTWRDAMAYCKWLSLKTGKKYSLPTEAQWEYAARGGVKSKKYKYSGSNDIDKVAWYDDTTYEKGPRQVGLLAANELGIYDMSGNAWEWCKDNFGMYSASAVKDPQGAASPQFKVIRGGSWYYVDDLARLTARDGPRPTYTNFNYGFRVVRLP